MFDRLRRMIGAWEYGWKPPPKQRSSLLGNVGGEIIPDRISTEPLTGYRIWRVMNSGGGGLRLASMHISHLWEYENTAVCKSEFGGFHLKHHPSVDAPDPDCSCGLYAMLPDSPVSLWDGLRAGSVTASGSISMSGRIIRCERGYKAQYATIDAPIVLDARCIHGCSLPPKWVVVPDRVHHLYWTVCKEHDDEEPAPQPTVRVGLAEWMRQACRELSTAYGVEVLTYHM